MTISIRQLGAVFVSLLTSAALLAFSTAAWSEPPEDLVDGGSGGSQHAAGELIVTYKDEAPEQEVESLDEEVGAEVEENLSEIDAKVLEFPEVKAERSEEVRRADLEQAKQELEQDPAVENVYYNHIRTGLFTPNDPKFGSQYDLRKPGFENAWNRTRGGGVRIAIVDSGVDTTVSDLRRKVVVGRDFVNGNNTVEDLHGHGTHVAGTAAARTGNRVGVAGACPNCSIVAAKVLDRNLEGFDSNIAKGIVWSANHGAKAINLSLGGPGEKSVLKNAIGYASRKGAVVAAAAGNGGSAPIYPAAYPNAIAVAATGRYDGRDSSYTTGDYIDVSAPGFDILSTVPNGYEYKSGTSMATPHVVGLAGLLSAQGYGPKSIKARIYRTAVDLGPRGKDPYYGYGRINADRATRR